MNQRSKILGLVFAAVIAIVFASKVVYPEWIEPLTTLDARLAAAHERVDELEDEEKRLDGYRQQYRDLVTRIGTFDIDRAATSVRDRINDLVERHKLRADSVAPSRARKDRKTDIESMTVNVKAVGTLESAIGFLVDLYKLPQLMQVGNVAIYPGSTRGDDRGPTPMNVRIPIEIWVLPQHKFVGRIELDATTQPEQLVRHEDRDYAPIWSGTPFDDWVPPVPLRVEIKATKTMVQPGDKVFFQGGATGGYGNYAYVWSPTDRLKNPENPRTELDTTEPGQLTYTLTATDEKGESASGTVSINIQAKPEPVARNNDRPPPPPPPPPPADSRWTDRMHRQLVMTLGRSGNDGRLDELMINNRRTKSNEYYAVGEDFDGGVIVFVHQTGGLVRRKDDPRNPKDQEGYYVYPLGDTLDRDIPVAQAEAFPELQRAVELDRASVMGAGAAESLQASAEVQPRGAAGMPLQIGIVGRVPDGTEAQAQQLPGGDAAAAVPAKEQPQDQREIRRRPRGGRPPQAPK